MVYSEILIEKESIYNSGNRLSYLPYKDLSHLFYGMSDGLKNQTKDSKEKNRMQLAKLREEATGEIREIAGIMVRIRQKNGERIKKIDKNDPNFELGKKASYLRYDSLENFLSGIEKGFEDQVEECICEKNQVLAELEKEVVKKIKESEDVVNKMSILSESHIRTMYTI